MRHFVIVSHTGAADGSWSLDDLCGAAGRVDVLCRALNSAFFLSHGIRDDVVVDLVFTDPQRPTTVRFTGAANRLNPDERSLASRIQKALRARGEDPWFDPSETGIDVAPFGLDGLALDPARLVLLDPEGEPLESADLPEDPVFLLSDHQPFTKEEYAALAAATRVSLGPHWYHGNHVVSCVHWVLDRRLQTP